MAAGGEPASYRESDGREGDEKDACGCLFFPGEVRLALDFCVAVGVGGRLGAAVGVGFVGVHFWTSFCCVESLSLHYYTYTKRGWHFLKPSTKIEDFQRDSLGLFQ